MRFGTNDLGKIHRPRTPKAARAFIKYCENNLPGFSLQLDEHGSRWTTLNDQDVILAAQAVWAEISHLPIWDEPMADT